MKKQIVMPRTMDGYHLWTKTGEKRVPFAFDLEITSRCNNNCRHCYINRNASDTKAEKNELTLHEIKRIADEAASLGSLWCTLTGGEPLLRDDFDGIYSFLKKRGFLVSVYTNATLVTEQHIELFKRYPPRNIEVSVYGVTEKTYEAITRKPGSFDLFNRGLDLLLRNGVKSQLKAMALRSNMHELEDIFNFCRRKTTDYFRFDPFLQMRVDQNLKKNKQIQLERLSPDEIAKIEREDPERASAIRQVCKFIIQEPSFSVNNYLMRCSAGRTNFSVSCDAKFHLCSSLCHPTTLYDLRNGNLVDAWNNFVPRVLSLRSKRKEYSAKCGSCPIINLCFWCPAHAHLETGKMDLPVDYYCQNAKKRADYFGLTNSEKYK